MYEMSSKRLLETSLGNVWMMGNGLLMRTRGLAGRIVCAAR